MSRAVQHWLPAHPLGGPITSPGQLGVYWRFENHQPQPGTNVHCWTNRARFEGFVRMMRRQDPDFAQMRFWEVTGTFVSPDDTDAVVRVISSREIRVT